MKYWELVKVGGKTSAPTSTPEDVGSNKDCRYEATEKALNEFLEEQEARRQEEDRKHEDLSNNVKTIMQIMEELKTQDCKPPEGFEETALNNDETAFVLTMLLEFQEKYFKDTPLTCDLSRSFVYNIPKTVYNAAKSAQVRGEPDCLNPLYWFYIFNLGDPEYMMATFLTSAINAISDDDLHVIDQLHEMYCEDNGIGYPVINDEDDETVDDAETPDLDEYKSIDPDTIDPIVNDDLTKTNDGSVVDISDFDPDITDASESNEEENDLYETSN